MSDSQNSLDACIVAQEPTAETCAHTETAQPSPKAKPVTPVAEERSVKPEIQSNESLESGKGSVPAVGEVSNSSLILTHSSNASFWSDEDYEKAALEANPQGKSDLSIELILQDWRETQNKLKVFNEEFRYYKLKLVEKKNQLHMKTCHLKQVKHRNATLQAQLEDCLESLAVTKKDCEEQMTTFRHLNAFVKNIQANLDKYGLEEDAIALALEQKFADYDKKQAVKSEWEAKLSATKQKFESLVQLKERLLQELEDIKNLSNNLKNKKETFMDSLQNIKGTINHFARRRAEMQLELQNLKIKEKLLQDHIEAEHKELCKAEISLEKGEVPLRIWRKISSISNFALDTMQYMVHYLLPTFPSNSSFFEKL